MTKRRRLLVSALAIAAVVAALALFVVTRPDGSGGTTVVETDAPGPLAVLRNGGFVFGEAGGAIQLVDTEDRVQSDAVAQVSVKNGSEAGLRGLAVDAGERIYASWVQPDGRLVVGWVDATSEHILWRGPMTSGTNTGGQIGFSPNGELIVVVGDLGDPSMVVDDAAPNGKLLSIDITSKSAAEAEVFSAGWNNPLAFAWDDTGRLWVADAPDSGPGRLVVGVAGGPGRKIEDGTVPGGMAGIDFNLLVCDVSSGELRDYEPRPDAPAEVLAEDCASGVAAESDTSVLYSTPDAIKRIELEQG